MDISVVRDIGSFGGTVCTGSILVFFARGFCLFVFVDDSGNLRTTGKGQKRLVSDESQTEERVWSG